jgi:hypothetical protein
MARAWRLKAVLGFGLFGVWSAACSGDAFHAGDNAAMAGSGGKGASSGSNAGGSSAGSEPQAGDGGSAVSGGEGGKGGNTIGGSSPDAGASPQPEGGESGTGGKPPELPPIPMDGLVYWFKADAGVTEDAGRISKWADQSGNHQNAKQDLAEQRPKLTHSDVLPLPVVELEGNQLFELPPIDAPIDAGLTFFAVAGRSDMSTCSAIIELSNGKEIDDVYFGSGAETAHFEVAANWYDAPGDVFPVGKIRLLGMTQAANATGTSIEIRVNGAFVGSGPVPFPVRLTRSQNFIGQSQYDNCSKFKGALAEIILYGRALPKAEQLAVETYLKAKWQWPD